MTTGALPLRACIFRCAATELRIQLCIFLLNPPRGGLQVERLLWGTSDDWCGRLRGSRKGNECSVIIYENNEIYSTV